MTVKFQEVVIFSICNIVFTMFHEIACSLGHYWANLGCVNGVDSFSPEFDVFDGKHFL